MLEKILVKNLDFLLAKNIPDKIAVAVSGGIDSVALLFLTASWARKKNIKITVLSVDHNLRPESRLEIKYVQNIAESLNCEFVQFSWQGSKLKTALQEKARNARYKLMSDYCINSDINLIFTAHHLDDMLETYLIKKAKKSSILALKPNISYFINNIWILRPLFNIPKFKLTSFLKENNVSWFEDSSNISDKYERNRVRKQISSLSNAKKSDLLAEYNLSIAQSEKLNKLLISAIAEMVAIYQHGFAKIDLVKFNNLENEIKIHLLNYVLTIIGGNKNIPRYRSLSKIIDNLASGNFDSCTLHNCCIDVKNQIIIIYKEQYKIMQETAKIIDEKKIIWDRFEIFLDDTQKYQITSLNRQDYSKLKEFFNLANLAKTTNNSHKRILFTLPVIKNLEKVVAIPHISYYDDFNKADVKIIFKSNFTSRFTHFF